MPRRAASMIALILRVCPKKLASNCRMLLQNSVCVILRMMQFLPRLLSWLISPVDAMADLVKAEVSIALPLMKKSLLR